MTVTMTPWYWHHIHAGWNSGLSIAVVTTTMAASCPGLSSGSAVRLALPDGAVHAVVTAVEQLSIIVAALMVTAVLVPGHY